MKSYSVLMSVYEKEKNMDFCAALDSMIRQTVVPDEIVLVCDGKLTPPLERSIAQYQTRYPSVFRIVRLPENRGLGLALREGLCNCRNELVARMDADDIALPDRMEKQLAFLEKHPQISAVGGQIAEFRENPSCIVDYRLVPTEPERIRNMACRRNPMNHMTVLMRKSKVLEAGNYRDLPGFEDYDLWARMLAKGQQLGNLADVCCHVRVGEKHYARRGGMDYFQNTIKMERILLDTEMITRRDYHWNVTMRFLGTVMVPTKLRGFLMHHLMRERAVRPVCEMGAMP